MKNLFFILLLILNQKGFAQLSPFEKSSGTETATYLEAVDWYKKLAKTSHLLTIKTMGPTDAGYPLHLVLLSADGKFDPFIWHKQGKVVILVNNGIHPGEPDGIDASMMLARDITLNKINLPPNVVLGIIPVYNIGGCLNRNSYTRANQNGPVSYGFRGNAQNLDLNRDFTKADSKNAFSFTEIFHYLNPDILVDNHVSDGADFQHTMTLISTQYDKLGDTLGSWLKNIFEPALYKSMSKKNWDMVPYVDFATTDFDKGMQMFMDPPRYSSGYAALFNTISFMPETHMLKPYLQRVMATYDLMHTFIEEVSRLSQEIKDVRKASVEEWLNKPSYPLKWQADSTFFSMVSFHGFNVAYAPSEATGLQKMFYDHNQPFTRDIKFYNQFKSADNITVPKAYIIPQGWFETIRRLEANKVKLNRLSKDTIILVSAYRIEEYKSYPTPYEKHHKNYGVVTSLKSQKIKFLKGDYLIQVDQPAIRYIIEMMEPAGDDSFFSWNFFDAILQQKEGYSDYRWEEIAAKVLSADTTLQSKLKEEKLKDQKMAANSRAILSFIYKNSNYYESAHMQYPVYRVEN